ncbi:MAG: helix-turn-helix transcriptional regulator [Oscillospiraceae bacterium]|jgi:DNA-binding CsgD family transcriptional regulator|nr:helix-turn-helix transcriptional regulator [Oscillospiraceae bacterium]
MTEQHPILVENEKKKLTFRLPMLICFAMFAAWQMGAIYFSGQTLSVDGRTPLPVDVDSVPMLVAAGYILSILVMIFLPRIIVWAQRVTCAVALLSVLALFLPLSPELLADLLYIQYFCCCFMIGFETAIIVGLFSEKSAVVHLTAAYGVAMVLVAILHNGVFAVTFPVFRLFSVVACVMQLFFYFQLPGRVWPRSVKKSDNLIAPKMLLISIFLWVVTACFVILFGNAVAETVPHGLLAYYGSAGAALFSAFFLWKCFGISPLKACSVFVVLGALGFLAALASLYQPEFSIVACVLLGAGGMSCLLQPLLGVFAAKQYPSRFISPVIIGTAFVAVLIHSTLLEVLRENTPLLYAVYLVIAVGMVILYLALRPYLSYSFHGKKLQDIIGVVAAETAPEEEIAAPETEAAQGTMIQKGENLHTQRMDILLKHAIQPLTPQEYRVADLIMQGHRRSEIADALGIKPESVSKYRGRIYSKFGIHKRQELFRLAESLDRERRDAKV